MNQWAYHDIVVQGDYVTVPDLPGAAGHRWFSETILDGLVPLWAPIGMLLKPVTGNVKGNVTVRNNTFIETPLAMLAAMRGVLFLGLHGNRSQVILNDQNMSGVKGVLRWGEMPLYEFGSPSVQVTTLAVEPYFATATAKVAVHFYAAMFQGYRSMSDNADVISKSEIEKNERSCYIPIASEHVLNNYLRVRAVPDGGRIKVTYLNGFTPAMLQQVWKEAKEYA